MTKPIITIYCDMDGVLVDMDRFISQELSPGAEHDPAILWPELQAIPNVFRRMPPLHKAEQIWRAILDTGLPHKILTAIPRVTTIPDAEADKNWWVEHHKDTVFCGQPPKVMIGPHSRDKWRHCKFGDILIDDMKTNCDDWRNAGGFAIHHTGDVEATIARLNFAVDQCAR